MWSIDVEKTARLVLIRVAKMDIWVTNKVFRFSIATVAILSHPVAEVNSPVL